MSYDDDSWKNDLDANPELRELVKTLRSYEQEDHGYIGWGPGDDYMSTPKDQEYGWNKNIEGDDWKTFWHGEEVLKDDGLKERMDKAGFKDNDWDLNFVADYYFSVNHDSEECGDCEGSGACPPCKELSDSFYGDDGYRVVYDGEGNLVGFEQVREPTEGWHNKITQDEVQALFDEDRLRDWDGKIPTAEEVNELQMKCGGIVMTHDAINKHILVRARAERLGLIEVGEENNTYCKTCNGRGSVRTGEDRLVFYAWLLHPRKGASRGITVKSVQPHELPEVKEFLLASYLKHQSHFEWACE